MPLSRRRLIREEFERLSFSGGGATSRFVPMWLQFHLHLRDTPEGKLGPALPGLFGGLWDRIACRYVDDANPSVLPKEGDELIDWLDAEVVARELHPGQVEAVLGNHDGLMRVMLLGGPGSGKTRGLSMVELKWCAQRPTTTGGMVAATSDRLYDPLWLDTLGVLPKTWVERASEYEMRIDLVNGRRIEFVAAKEPSKLIGSAIQGKSWRDAGIDETQSIHDRSQMDVDERGRRYGTDYCVFETATRFGNPHFEDRLESYTPEKHAKIIKVSFRDNTFTDPAYFERMKDRYSERDFRRRFLLEDVAPENMAYPSYSRENVRPAPIGGNLEDVTRKITKELFGGLAGAPQNGAAWIVGTDWGTLCHASIWLKAFRDPKDPGRLLWWAMRETYTRSSSGDAARGGGATAADHMRRLMQFAHPSDFVVIGDPGINTKDTSKSDYHLARNEGVFVRPAYFKPIEVKHRVSMFNVLCHDAHGRRRFFIDCDDHGHPRCKDLAKHIRLVEIGPDGKLEGNRKNYSDPSHGPAATQFGMFPWERIRGLSTFEAMTGADEDPIALKAQQFAERRERDRPPWP